jgi:hypothetical protein
MSKLTAASLALVVLATATLAFGTGSYSSVAADRGVSVEVVGDDDALVGYDAGDTTVSDGESVELVTLHNKLSAGVTVASVSVDAPSDEFAFAWDGPFELGVGKTAAVEGDVSCAPGSEQRVGVTVTLSGESVAATIDGDTREFTVTCEAEERGVSNAKFAGKGQFKADTSGSPTVTYWTSEDGETFTEQAGEFTGKLNPKGKAGVVAVYFESLDVTYVHPAFDAADGELDGWGQGSQQACEVAGKYDPNTATADPCSDDGGEPGDAEDDEDGGEDEAEREDGDSDED